LRRDVTIDPTDDRCAKERFGGTALQITPCPFVSGDPTHHIVTIM